MAATSPDENEPDDSALLEALRQNWSHARHIEGQQRLTLGSVNTVLSASGLAISVFLGDVYLRAVLFLSLFVLTMAGFLATLKWNAEFVNHIRAIDMIVHNPRIRLRGYMALPLESPKPFGSVRHLFIIDYVFLCSLWLTLVLDSLLFVPNYPQLRVIGILLFFVTTALVMSLLAIFYDKRMKEQLDRRYGKRTP